MEVCWGIFVLTCLAVGATSDGAQVLGDCPVVSPSNDTFGLCQDQCHNDTDCTASSQKCCFSGCGNVCTDVTISTTPVPCPEVLCMIACPYGYQQDKSGCSICACNSQTIIHSGDCPSIDDGAMGICVDDCQHDGDCADTQKCCSNSCGHQCRDAVDNSQSPIKPGQCPAANGGSVGVCTEDCVVDTDCSGELKCCSNGCGHKCLQPVAERPGTCPVGSLPDGAVGTCSELCINDQECPASRKCCSNGCGHSCILPLDLPVIHEGSCLVIENNGFGACFEACDNDANCPSSQKCCSNGCGHNCMPAIKEPECPPVVCLMWCPHGYQKDSNGCDTCWCNQQTVIHAGECPTADDGGMGMCGEMCGHDGNCTDTQKCCSNGCGHTCVEAIQPDPTYAGCPVIEPNQMGVCITDCTMHADCSDPKLCCPNACGYQCIDPVAVHAGTCPTGSLSMGITGICSELCTNDGDCPSSNQKCCSNGCGHACITVDTPPVTCPDVSCRIFCQFGFRKDSDGCDICECFTPPAVHPGNCPVGVLPESMIGSCAESCQGDEDCADREKCCSNGCGRSCVNATAILCPDIMCTIYCEHGYQQDQNGCDMCNCREKPEKCGDVFCAMHCPYGFKKRRDGCPVCECQDMPKVCSEVMCMIYCENGYQRNDDGCEVCMCNEQPPVIRPGTCPVVALGPDFGLCADMCDNDDECPTNQKCCSNSCGGHQCMDAENIPGICPLVHCMVWCPHGFQQDKNGCDLCLCNQQTKVHVGSCPAAPTDGVGICSESCSHDGVCAQTEKCCPNSCGARQCMSADAADAKPGTCPVASDTGIGVCTDACTSDANCTSTKKCCSNGCGHQCEEALNRPVVRPGKCPVGPLPEGMGGVCAEICQVDSDCAENQKCCSNGCGHACITSVETPDECGDVMCSMFCEYGFKRDENNCEICSCNVPPVTHSGECPVSQSNGDSMGICTDVCTSDDACPDHQKCCSNGCGHSCADAVKIPVVHPGSCPTGNLPSELSMGVCAELCQGDEDCDSQMKCCSNGCGRQCLKAVGIPVCSDVMCMMFCIHGFQKDSNGCDTCVCNTQPATCPPITCDRFCKEGFVVDENGCDTCKCKGDPDVCLPIMCNMYCEFGFDKDPATGCVMCSCRQLGDVMKEGTCPVVTSDSSSDCTDECKVDADCEELLKCCHRGCGHACTKPQKPGNQVGQPSSGCAVTASYLVSICTALLLSVVAK